MDVYQSTDMDEAQKMASVNQGGVQEIQLDPVLEKQTLRRFDMFLLPQIALLIIIGYLDRSNIGRCYVAPDSKNTERYRLLKQNANDLNLVLAGNAVVFGLVKDLNLQGREFNNLVTLFYVTYIVCDIPWVISIKRFGANRVLGVAILGWSTSTLGTGFVQNYHQALACRLLLGIFEAGLLPCMVFIISTIWNKNQHAKRIAVIYCATTISGAFGGLFAYGVQSMGERAGLESWRWLFIIEGIVSFVIGGLCWITMPYSAEKAWFLTKEQSAFMEQKKQRDALYKGEEDTFKLKYVWAALFDPLVYLVAFSLFASSLPLLGFGTFLPTIIRGLGYVLKKNAEEGGKRHVLTGKRTQVYRAPSQLSHDPSVRPRDRHRGADGLAVRPTAQESLLSPHGAHPRADRIFYCHRHAQHRRGLLRHVPLRRRHLPVQLPDAHLDLGQPGAGLQTQRGYPARSHHRQHLGNPVRSDLPCDGRAPLYQRQRRQSGSGVCGPLWRRLHLLPAEVA